MRSTAGLAVWLFTVSQGMGQSCDGRKEGAQCYGSLAGKVVLHLMDRAAQFTYVWGKERKLLLKGSENNIETEPPERFSFNLKNGMMTIQNLTKADSGNYTLLIHNVKETGYTSRTLQLFIEAPVTSIHLTSECLSQGEQPISCSSEDGDSLQYRWSLNQNPLQDSDLLSGNVQANNITLKPGVSGQLVCSIRNNINEIMTEVYVSCVFINCTSKGTLISQWLPEISKTICDDLPSELSNHRRQSLVLLIRSIFLTVIILIMIAVVIFYTLQAKRNKTHEVEEDYHELMYINAPREVLR
ncbi:uncharacterized protein LOC144025967 [Festucalex cinctus]